MTDLKPAPDNILVIQLARFGDFLQTTPLLSVLKARHPETRVSVLVDKGRTELAEKNPDIDEVLSVDLNLLAGIAQSGMAMSDKLKRLQAGVKPLKTEPYGLVINLNYSRVAALLANLIRAERYTGPRFGSDRRHLTPSPWAGFILNLMTHRRLIRFNLVDLLTVYAEASLRPPDGLTYPVSAEDSGLGFELLGRTDGRALIGFQLGSRHASRQWPVENFAQLGAELIAKKNVSIVLLGTSEEAHFGRLFLEFLRNILKTRNTGPHHEQRVINLMGRTTIPALAGVLSHLNLLVTTDTGSMHLAAAVKTPILTLFMGPAFCHETGPYGSGHVIAQAMAECGPCQENEAGCEDAFCRYLITPGLIFSLVDWFLSNQASPLPSRDAFGPDVRLLISSLDDFGTVYRPLVPWPLTVEDILATAYREAGRAFMRPGYALKEEKIASEFSVYTDPEEVELEHVRQSLERIIQLIPSSPFNRPPTGLRELAEETKLKPLIRTVFGTNLGLDVRFRMARDMLRVISVNRKAIGRLPSSPAPEGVNWS
ncbi:MAG: hypothetical protein JRD68_01355 [Deltaproteobacteria bacterium]|nr:hypothetical protein [Deltaproteobacteria bacterium]